MIDINKKNKLLLLFVSFNLMSFSQSNPKGSEMQTDSIPYVLYNEKKISIKDYITKNFIWKEGMNEYDKIAVEFIIDESGNVKNISYNFKMVYDFKIKR